MKLPKFSQWKQIFKVLSKTEKKWFLVFIFLFLTSLLYFLVYFYSNITKISPAFGGSYAEGIVGQPRFINPVYGDTNDVDRTLIDLIYSGLMTYDKNGNLAADLAESWKVSEDGKTYTFQLKNNLSWQDGVPITADDVVYTIQTIQNSDYKSPLRANWLDVEIKKKSELSFILSLMSPYSSFLENCTVKIIPKHIWENILPENFALSSYNLQPVGSGPYLVSDLSQTSTGFIKSIKLKSNPKYHDKKPYIPKISFYFFEREDDLIEAAYQKTIDGFSVDSLNSIQHIKEKETKQNWISSKKFNEYSFSLPRYFAVFFNAKDESIFSDTNITQALNYAVNKKELAENIKTDTEEDIFVVNSPILPNYYGYSEPSISYEYDKETAEALLDKSGFKTDSNGQRVKSISKTAAFQFKNYLSSKSSGTQVIELQRCLAKLDENFKNLLADEVSGRYGSGTEKAVTAFQEKYLYDLAPTGEVGASTRKKLNELCFSSQDDSVPLIFTITTINQPQLIKTCEILTEYWAEIGVSTQIKAVELSELKDIIKNRDYEALLYGQALGAEPDLYPFWHSSQIKDPGLNLSEFQSKDADQLLKEARESMDKSIKTQKYESLQDKILVSTPALFLYNPNYMYWVSEKIKGIETTKIIDPAKRFSNIKNWYINTKRILK